MFVADTMNHCIRRVDGRTGRVTTVAGSGKAGYSGDGGLATAARLNEPYGVAVDRRGNLYIVDRLNACVRWVDGRTGIIGTLAGTGKAGYGGDFAEACLAPMKEPNGLALDGRGSLYIADVGASRIRRVDLRTHVITTFSGTGERKFAGDGGRADTASIQGARAVDVSRSGAVYICEREGNRIRAVDPITGAIRTLAGTGRAGYSGDGGSALQATFNGPKWVHVSEQNLVYVIDTENHCVREIDPERGTIRTVAGDGKVGGKGDGLPATQAQMDRPHGCAVYRGILYIADTNNHRIRACKLDT
jgi:sugar lactone lactonase YvrE